MKKLLSRLFGGQVDAPSETTKPPVQARRLQAPALVLRTDATCPIVLSALDERAARSVLDYVEKTRKRILRVLELTHCMVQHLPLPAWLNEGIAVNTEQRLSPPLGRPLHTPEEMHEKHLAFWNETTIQEFWSGKSWLRSDDGNSLSYDLAQHFVSMAGEDFSVFRTFVNAADGADAGDAAARAHLGYPLSHLAHAVLGDGSWEPLPEKWKEGVERGQFPSALRCNRHRAIYRNALR